MTAAIFGLIGVVIGAVLSAVLNHELQRRQDVRRWKREDQTRYQSERLSLYRDFLNEVERTNSGAGLEREKLYRMLSEIELLGTYAIYKAAARLFQMAELWVETHQGTDENSEETVEVGIQAHIYEFVVAVRRDLGVPELDERSRMARVTYDPEHPDYLP